MPETKTARRGNPELQLMGKLDRLLGEAELTDPEIVTRALSWLCQKYGYPTDDKGATCES